MFLLPFFLFLLYGHYLGSAKFAGREGRKRWEREGEEGRGGEGGERKGREEGRTEGRRDGGWTKEGRGGKIKLGVDCGRNVIEENEDQKNSFQRRRGAENAIGKLPLYACVRYFFRCIDQTKMIGCICIKMVCICSDCHNISSSMLTVLSVKGQRKGVSGAREKVFPCVKMFCEAP